jgi:hypothetical protein
MHALALGVLVAGEERGELDRDAVAAFRPHRGVALAPRDGGDRVQVAGLVALGIGLGAGALAQHVVGKAQLRLGLALLVGLGLGLLDGAAQHELPAQQLDGAHRGRHHAARAQPGQQAAGFARLGQELLRHGQRGGRQAGQHAAAAVTGAEVGPAELVGRQGHRGLHIGHPQQGLGQAHQGQALGAGDGVLAQQRLHGPEGRRVGAHRLHPGRGRDGRRPVQAFTQPGPAAARAGPRAGTEMASAVEAAAGEGRRRRAWQ